LPVVPSTCPRLAPRLLIGIAGQAIQCGGNRALAIGHDGPVVTGWGAIARTEDQAHQVVLDLINESRP
jgi:hypothetical protein